MELQVGQILCGAHHYAARHPYWYVVKKVSASGKTAIVHRVKDEVVTHDGYGQNGTMTCAKDANGNPIEKEGYKDVRCKVEICNTKYSTEPYLYVSNKKYSISLYKWNGEPEDFYTD